MLWLYGGGENDTITGGNGGDVIQGGSGQNVIHEGNGWNSPEIVDDSDGVQTGIADSFVDGADWTAGPAGTSYNGGEQVHAAAANGSPAVWTFANLAENEYYDVCVTWATQPGAATAAQYVVGNAGGALLPVGQYSIAPVDQTLGPADFQSAGTFWDDLGVFDTGNSTTLTVQLRANTSGAVLADAVQLIQEAGPPTTNLQMNSFTADSSGNLWVSYTISGAAAPQFNIGVYSSSDGRQPQDLLQSVPVDSADLGPGTYTVPLGLTLANLDSDGFFLAMLDADDAVEEFTKADNVSAPIAATYQDDNGGVHVFTPASGLADSVTVSQDPTTGDVTVDTNGTSTTYQNVSEVYGGLQGNGGSVSAAGVDLPMTVYGGPGADSITGGDDSNTIYAGSGADTISGGTGNNEIYGGTGFDILDGSQGQNNWIQAGPGGGVITGGDGNDWLYGGSAGTTTINGGNGTEVIHGGAGTNYLYGGSGLDNIYGGSGPNWMYGNGANDILQGGTGSNFIQPNYQRNGGLASIEVEGASDQATFDGTMDADGNQYLGDYQAVDPGYQNGSSASGSGGHEWTFGDLDSGVRLGEDATTPLAVYATWQPNGSNYTDRSDNYTGTHWAIDAVYKVYDNGTLLTPNGITVDQQDSPGNDSPEPNDRPWKLLGVWDIGASDTITVELVSGSISNGVNSDQGGMLCAGDVMIHALWPTVSIRPTNVTVNPMVPPANAGDYVDWVDACQGVSLPVEGQGDRVQFQLQASMDPLYASIQNASMSDWQAALNVQTGTDGVEFWTSAAGGNPLSPSQINALVDPGDYSGTVWGSVQVTDTSSLAASFEISLDFLDAILTAQVAQDTSAEEVPTANIIRTKVVQANAPNDAVASVWKFSLTQALPYDVVIVQRIQYAGPGVVPQTARTSVYNTYYFEEIGTILHGQTEITVPATNPPRVQPFDDVWFGNVPNVINANVMTAIGNASVPMAVPGGQVTMSGQVRAFVAPKQSAGAQVPNALQGAQVAAAKALTSFVKGPVWYQRTVGYTKATANKLDLNKPYVTAGILLSSPRFGGTEAWKKDWVGSEIGAAGSPRAGQFVYHWEKVAIKGSNAQTTNQDAPAPEQAKPTDVWHPGEQEWRQ